MKLIDQMKHRLIDPKALDQALEAASQRKAAPPAPGSEQRRASQAFAAAVARETATMASTALRHVATNTEAALDNLAARLEALESKRSMAFAGPYDPGHSYDAGDVVQKGGGLFVAMAHARVGDSPGSSAAWREIARAK